MKQTDPAWRERHAGKLGTAAEAVSCIKSGDRVWGGGWTSVPAQLCAALAARAGEITNVTRGRGQQRAAAIVPAELVDRYEAMIDSEDGRVAMERLADLDAGRTKTVSADEVARALGP